MSENSSLAGYVYVDANNSGTRMISGVAKRGIAGVTITLQRTDVAAAAQTAVTQSDGSYSFGALAAGTMGFPLIGGAQIFVCRRFRQEPVCQHQVITAAVATNAFPDLDSISRSAQRINSDVSAILLQCAGHRAVTVDVDFFLHLMLKPALGAVKNNVVTFPRIECVEGVAHRCAGVVTHQHIHRVLDIDIRAEHAAIAEIAVVLLVIEVKFFEVRAAREVEEEGAFVFFRAALPFSVCKIRASRWPSRRQARRRATS